MTTTALAPRRGRGRPLKLTEEVTKKVTTAIAAGNVLDIAARYGGIGRTSFFDYMSRGERAKAERSRRKADQPFIDFYERVMEAEIEAEVGAVAQLRAHFPNNPRAIQWWLERRHRERWAPARQVDAEGVAADGNVAIALVQQIGVNIFDRRQVLALAREVEARVLPSTADDDDDDDD